MCMLPLYLHVNKKSDYDDYEVYAGLVVFLISKYVKMCLTVTMKNIVPDIAKTATCILYWPLWIGHTHILLFYFR